MYDCLLLVIKKPHPLIILKEKVPKKQVIHFGLTCGGLLIYSKQVRFHAYVGAFFTLKVYIQTSRWS